MAKPCFVFSMYVLVAKRADKPLMTINLANLGRTDRERRREGVTPFRKCLNSLFLNQEVEGSLIYGE